MDLCPWELQLSFQPLAKIGQSLTLNTFNVLIRVSSLTNKFHEEEDATSWGNNGNERNCASRNQAHRCSVSYNQGDSRSKHIIQIHISQAMNFVIIFLLLCSLFVQISTNITAIVLGQLFTLTLGSNIRQRRRAVQFTAVTVPNDAQHDLYNFHNSSARLAPATAFLRRTPSSPPRQPRPSLASSHCSHQQRGKQIVLS